MPMLLSEHKVVLRFTRNIALIHQSGKPSQQVVLFGTRIQGWKSRSYVIFDWLRWWDIPKHIWGFPKIVVPQNGWFIVENSRYSHVFSVYFNTFRKKTCMHIISLFEWQHLGQILSNPSIQNIADPCGWRWQQRTSGWGFYNQTLDLYTTSLSGTWRFRLGFPNLKMFHNPGGDC